MQRKTRNELLKEKIEQARKFDFAIATINFQFDGNLGFAIRSAACFGAKEVLVVGALPPPRRLRQLSASTNKYIPIKQFANPSELLQYNRDQNYRNIALELAPEAMNLNEYSYPSEPICLITGHETYGIPSEIYYNSEKVYIPMPGVGRCLNTSQAITIAMYELQKQMQ